MPHADVEITLADEPIQDLRGGGDPPPAQLFGQLAAQRVSPRSIAGGQTGRQQVPGVREVQKAMIPSA